MGNWLGKDPGLTRGQKTILGATFVAFVLGGIAVRFVIEWAWPQSSAGSNVVLPLTTFIMGFVLVGMYAKFKKG